MSREAMRRALARARSIRMDPRDRTDAEVNAAIEQKYRRDAAAARGELNPDSARRIRWR